MNISARLNESNIMNLPENEEAILKSWNDSKLLDKIKESRKNGPNWNFLDGPPFVINQIISNILNDNNVPTKPKTNKTFFKFGKVI